MIKWSGEQKTRVLFCHGQLLYNVITNKKLAILSPIGFSFPTSLGMETKIKHHIAHNAPQGDTNKSYVLP